MVYKQLILDTSSDEKNCNIPKTCSCGFVCGSNAVTIPVWAVNGIFLGVNLVLIPWTVATFVFWDMDLVADPAAANPRFMTVLDPCSIVFVTVGVVSIELVTVSLTPQKTITGSSDALFYVTVIVARQPVTKYSEYNFWNWSKKSGWCASPVRPPGLKTLFSL